MDFGGVIKMNVTFLNEAVLVGKLSVLPTYLKSKAKENPDYLKLLGKFKNAKSENLDTDGDWDFTYPDFKTPSGWFPLQDGSIVIGYSISQDPIFYEDFFRFAVLYLDKDGEPNLRKVDAISVLTIHRDIDCEEERWCTDELKKAATRLAMKLTREYAQKRFADYSAMSNFFWKVPLYSIWRTGERLTSPDQKPDASQEKIEVWRK